MKKILSVLLVIITMFSLCSCSKQGLADMTTLETDEYTVIVWDDRNYVPYCAISKSECGQQIGIVDGDEDDRVYEYKGHSSDEWIINSYVMDSAMLYREITVTDIPDGLQSEYKWNN